MQDAQLQYSRGAFIQHARTGEPAMRNGAKSLAGGMAPAGIYPCKPGGPNDYVYLFASPTNPQHWRRLLEAIGHAELIEDPRFATPAARAQHEAEIEAMLTEWTMRHDKHEAMRLVGAAGVPAGAVFDTGDLLAEPSFAERGIIQTMQHPSGALQMPAFPVRFDGAPAPVEPSPLLGQHTREVFGDWLGMSAGEVDGLHRRGSSEADMPGRRDLPPLSRRAGGGDPVLPLSPVFCRSRTSVASSPAIDISPACEPGCVPGSMGAWAFGGAIIARCGYCRANTPRRNGALAQ